MKNNLKLLLCAAALSFVVNNTSAMEDASAMKDEALSTELQMTTVHHIKRCQEELISACRKGEIEEAARLLTIPGIDVNKKDIYGWTLLYNASITGRMPIVKLLLNQGADANIADNDGKTSLSAACTIRIYIDIVELLLNWGADVNRADNYGQTALSWVCIYNLCPTAELLLNWGADVNKANNIGCAPLHNACFFGKPLVELLLNHGAAINIVNKKGETPLSIAKKREKHDVVAILISHLYQLKMPFLRFVYGCGYSEGQNFTDDNVPYSLKGVFGSHDLKRTIAGYI